MDVVKIIIEINVEEKRGEGRLMKKLIDWIEKDTKIACVSKRAAREKAFYTYTTPYSRRKEQKK